MWKLSPENQGQVGRCANLWAHSSSGLPGDFGDLTTLRRVPQIAEALLDRFLPGEVDGGPTI